MTNEELDELQKVRSIVDKFKDIDEKVCTPEQAFDEEEIIKGNHSSSNGSHVMCMW